MSAKTRIRRNRKQFVADAIVAAKRAGTASAAEMGLSTVQAGDLVAEGVLKMVGTRPHTDPETGKTKRGRPVHVYKLAKKGHDRARRLVNKPEYAVA